MKNNQFYSSSRRRTPWDGKTDLTPIQSFIKSNYLDAYNRKHPKLSETNEADFINSFKVDACKYCGKINFKKAGFTSNGIQRYKCNDCNRTFNVLTNTLFDNHKISILEWIEYLLNIFGYSSFNSTSRNSKIAYSTTKYWLLKLFEVLKDYQDSIVLKGNVYIDETFYNVIKKDMTNEKASGDNRYCIGIGYDGEYTYCKVEGRSRSSSFKWTKDTFISHIKEGSVLIHDEAYSHSVLIEPLKLIDKKYSGTKCKTLPDEENPLQPINDKCSMLKSFLNAHRGFDRNELQDYLNLFCFISNPPYNKLEKIEYLLNLTMGVNKTMKYRDLFLKNTDK